MTTVKPELVDDRQAWLLNKLFEQRRLLTVDIASELDVSVDTIRRDLRALHDQGLLRRVHGGAVPISRLPESFSGRTSSSMPVRSKLASAIVDRIQAGQIVGLDGGTTSVEIAQLLPPTLAVTIVTNNPAAAVAMADHKAATVVLLGGAVDLTWMATVGPEVVDGWRTYRLDVGVLGVCGFDSVVGATTNSQSEVATKRALIEASAELVVPLQSEKVGANGPFVISEPDAIDVVVVEDLLDNCFADECRDAAIEIVVAH